MSKHVRPFCLILMFVASMVMTSACAPKQPISYGRAPEVIQPFTGIQVGQTTLNEAEAHLGRAGFQFRSFVQSGVRFYQYKDRGDQLLLQEKNGRIAAEIRKPESFSQQATLWYYKNLWANERTEVQEFRTKKSGRHKESLKILMAPDLGLGAVYDPINDRVIQVIRYE